jgi:DNA-directed RNA polymerase sigma subunit (sigma70/sigma32)
LNTTDTKRRKRGEHSEPEGTRPRSRAQTSNTRQRRRRERADDVDVRFEPLEGEASESREEVASPAVSLDSLDLFFRQARRYKLLTAAEEVELAQRVERGDLEAKDRMINANLRLVVSQARR